METTTIQINKDIKERLESMKMYQRETFNELILRLISDDSLENTNRESLIATIEVMSDPELIRGIQEGLQEEGGTPIEEFEKELRL